MSIVIDTTQSPSSTSMRSAGVVALCRYLSLNQDNTAFKRILQPEFDRLLADGFGVVLNWEYDGHDWLGGRSAGELHATTAAAAARALGYNPGCAIPGSADFDMTLSQWNGAANAYAEAFSRVLRAEGYRPGVYGPYDALTWCRDAGYMDMFWQSMSTAHSGGRNANYWPGGQLWQRGHLSVGGQDVDYNEIRLPNYGAMTAVSLVATPPAPLPGGLLVDGVMGVHTISAWQRRMGTPVDGVITQPPGRSSLIMAVQRYLNAKIGAQLTVDGVGIDQDGHTFYKTQRALQVYLGTVPDGVLSLPTSMCVAHLQARLNGSTF